MSYTADFETTTQQNDCRVWAWGLCEIGNTSNFIYGNDMQTFLNWCSQQQNETLYFHNLKFDGEFIISYLLKHGYTHIKDKRKATSKSFTTLIADTGQYYTMSIYFYVEGKKSIKVTINNSLLIIPFSVRKIAVAFNLPIMKGDIDYKAERPVGHILTSEEVDYLRNDVEIVARALKTLFDQNLKKITQGSNAMSDFKNIIGEKTFKRSFPVPDYDDDIRRSYKGGWTYCDPRTQGKDIGEGIVFDVNSLYPSVMYYSPLPYGEGMFFEGEYQEDKLYNLYIQMVSCQFEIKPDHLPTIQLKNNMRFAGNEYLTSSDGETITLCLTSVDLQLLKDHYNLSDVTYHSGWKFKSTTGLFKDYIDKWNKVKMESTLNGNDGMRTLAKLMLNALYGKFALNPRVQSKEPYLNENNVVKYRLLEAEQREPVYIPVGTFITSWARYKTISSAQKVYDRFLYADTDSLHLRGTEIPDELEIDSVKLGAWKHESTFTRARFLRQKCYVEEIEGELHVTCAGMPKQCHDNVTWENFKIGQSFEGKLQMTHVDGGIVLKDIDFSIKM